MSEQKLACECCGYLTVEEHGNYDICPVCFWEDDGPWPDPTDELMRCGPNHGLTLVEARANFARYGACEHGISSSVRPPRDDEHPRTIYADPVSGSAAPERPQLEVVAEAQREQGPRELLHLAEEIYNEFRGERWVEAEFNAILRVATDAWAIGAKRALEVGPYSAALVNLRSVMKRSDLWQERAGKAEADLAAAQAVITRLRGYVKRGQFQHRPDCACVVPGGTSAWVPPDQVWQGDQAVCTCGLKEVVASLHQGEDTHGA